MTNDELDRLCAEKIMGWKHLAGEFVTQQHFPLEPIRYGDNSSGGRWWTVYQPTKNIAQAWELLEKFNKWAFHSYASPAGRHYSFTIYIDYEYQMGKMFGGHEDTAPLAIVKACLKAKGVEVA